LFLYLIEFFNTTSFLIIVVFSKFFNLVRVIEIIIVDFCFIVLDIVSILLSIEIIV